MDSSDDNSGISNKLTKKLVDNPTKNIGISIDNKSLPEHQQIGECSNRSGILSELVDEFGDVPNTMQAIFIRDIHRSKKQTIPSNHYQFANRRYRCVKIIGEVTEILLAHHNTHGFRIDDGTAPIKCIDKRRLTDDFTHESDKILEQQSKVQSNNHTGGILSMLVQNTERVLASLHRKHDLKMSDTVCVIGDVVDMEERLIFVKSYYLTDHHTQMNHFQDILDQYPPGSEDTTI